MGDMRRMKGVLFSFIIVVVALALVSIIAIQKELISFYGEKLAIETRVSSMNNLYESIIDDAGKALEIISKRAASVADSFVITTGKVLPQANASLLELIVNGTLNSTPEVLMEDATITVWKNKMEEIGDLNGFDTNVSFSTIEVKPYDSWNLLIRAEISVNLTDQQGVASLKRNDTVSQLVSIEGLEDPLVPLYTYGRVHPDLIRSPYWNNFTQFNGTHWDIENLKKDIENSYYHPSVKGASFLDRLEGKLEVQPKYQAQASGPIGLESFVDKGAISAEGIAVEIEKTNIDHLYFSTSSYPGRKVTGLETTSFRIDEELCGSQKHSEIYGVSNLLI